MKAGRKLLVLAVASVALGVVSARAQELSSAERERAVASLDATRAGFLKSVEGLSEAQWSFKAAPDRWSIAECAEHIAVSEDTIMGLVRGPLMKSPADPARRAEVAGKDEAVLAKVPDRSKKFQAPEILKPTGRFATPAEAVKAFEASRAAAIEYVRTTKDDLRDHFYEHPAMKVLDGYQWILLTSAHSERHTKQIDEVKADPAFPKS